ncbi:hypothetical protein [Patulibacter minatonensis]|uniref:hypothetical protein n=1 Tax=Patulibacter minatonensis TaxID=298163 RepID=UPI00047A74BF|nr:hypothetical protein [Patulibacter minatonensis]
MGVVRRLLGTALQAIDAAGERSHAKELAKLTPAERERYDQWEARGAASRAGVPEAELVYPRLVGAVLHGPAGEALHGVTERPSVRDAIDDPAAWEACRRAERAARDAVRAPYRSPARRPLLVTRVMTRDGSQLEDLGAHLAATGLAARPDLVFGVHRVPDHISAGVFRGGRSGPVEWAVLHAPADGLAPADVPAVLSLDARERLVDRAKGAPSPLDEDLALDLLRRARVGPERTIGIARDLAIERGGDEHSASMDVVVRGLHVLTVPAEAAALSSAAEGAPWRIAAGPPEDVVVDVLQWDAIARAVHPVRQHRPPLPSPFAYLPLTAHELLGAYLDVVGLDPADAYAAQVTHDAPFDLLSRTSARTSVRRTGGGPELPCADGVPRRRMTGGHHVVVAYRDRPAYAEGRARFDAYAETELRAHLRTGLALRRPVPAPAGRLMGTIDRVGVVTDFVTGEWGDDHEHPPPRYCWPPAEG